MRLLLAALLACSALATPAAAQTKPIAVKPIEFTSRTLANGLKVYAIRDTTTPNVSIQVWYDVGAKNDPAGRSGFAHMFEHLMFKATRNLPSEAFDRLTEDVGGYNNASTDDDYTDYFELVPANHLQRLLFAEADRMASLVVEPVSFASERNVVKEELRQRTLARPYGKLFSIYYPEISYTVHPYARPAIGNIADLEAASIDDVRAFHALYYRPDNAVLVVSGNFDPAQLNKWVDEYFGPIKRPDRPIPRVTAKEPARTQAISRTVYEPNTPLPAVLMSWHLPPDRDADIPALTVLDAVLATGDSSRLKQDLVDDHQIARSVQTVLDTKQSTGNLAAIAILASGKSAADGEAALRRNIARLRDQPITDAELDKAKNQLLTDAIRRRETAEGKARIIASAAIVDGDPGFSDRQFAAIVRVGTADVQRVARKYLNDNQSATIHYLSAGAKPAGAPAETIAVAPTVAVKPLVAPPGVEVVTAAPPGERIAPPAPGKPIKPTLPQPVEARAANGMRLVTVERHDLPIVTALLVAVGGEASNRNDLSGLANLTAGIQSRGTTTRSRAQFAEQFEALGGTIDFNADRDSQFIAFTVKSDGLSPAMNILADAALHPAFAPDEIEEVRAEAIDRQTVALSNPSALAGMVASRLVFGTRAYGAPLEGTPASLKKITREDIVQFYRRIWQPARMALVMVGDVTPATSKRLADQLFPATPGATQEPAPTPVLPPFPAPRVVVVDMPDAGQAAVVVARPGIARTDDRYYPLTVANTVLGGGFSSRLNQEVRIKRGLAYGASSSVVERRLPGPILAATQTKNPTATEVVQLIEAEMKRMGSEPIPTGELDTRKALLIGGFGQRVETTDGIASLLSDYVAQGVPLGELQRFTGKVTAVDDTVAQAAAAALLDPAPASIVVVGDAKQFIAPLRKAYPKVEVIPAGALRLDTPALR